MPSALDMLSMVPLIVMTRSMLKLLTSFKLEIRNWKKKCHFILRNHHPNGMCTQHTDLETVILVSVSNMTRLMVLPPLPMIRPIRLLCAKIFNEISLQTKKNDVKETRLRVYMRLECQSNTLCWYFRLLVASLRGCGDTRSYSSPGCRKWWWLFLASRHSPSGGHQLCLSRRAVKKQNK